MKECAEKGQVMYWGLNKIDTKILNSAQSTKKISLDKARTNKIKFETRLKKLTKDYDASKDKEKKQTLKKELSKLIAADKLDISPTSPLMLRLKNSPDIIRALTAAGLDLAGQ